MRDWLIFSAFMVGTFGFSVYIGYVSTHPERPSYSERFEKRCETEHHGQFYSTNLGKTDDVYICTSNTGKILEVG